VIFDVSLPMGSRTHHHGRRRPRQGGGGRDLHERRDGDSRGRAATPAIPIVFTLVADPVAAGVVKSLAQPAGNVTGISSLATELVPKRLEALKPSRHRCVARGSSSTLRTPSGAALARASPLPRASASRSCRGSSAAGRSQ